MQTPKKSLEASKNQMLQGIKIMVDGGSTGRDLALAALAECLGTAILIFLGCIGCVGTLGVTPSHVQSCFTFGITVLIVVQCFGHISHAHVNPAITLSSIVLGIKTLKEGLIYFVAQIIGATLGYGLLKIVTPSGLLSSNQSDPGSAFCITDLHASVNQFQGLMLEVLATAVLVLVAGAIWDPRNAKNSDSVAIKFGLIVCALATVIGPYTGCSMNPARSLAPALWTGHWNNHWIYWLGPFAGALLASLGYKLVFWPDMIEERAGEDNLPETVILKSSDLGKGEVEILP